MHKQYIPQRLLILLSIHKEYMRKAYILKKNRDIPKAYIR